MHRWHLEHTVHDDRGHGSEDTQASCTLDQCWKPPIVSGSVREALSVKPYISNTVHRITAPHACFLPRDTCMTYIPLKPIGTRHISPSWRQKESIGAIQKCRRPPPEGRSAWIIDTSTKGSCATATCVCLASVAVPPSVTGSSSSHPTSRPQRLATEHSDHLFGNRKPRQHPVEAVVAS